MARAFCYGDNVDTDVIIPARYLVTGDPKTLGLHCLENLDPDFVKAVRPGDVVVGRRNFGCGSSREHAVWALDDYGFRAVIAPSFADIFRNNCLKNGFLPVALEASVVRRIMDGAIEREGYRLAIDLEGQVVADEHGLRESFGIEPFYKQRLLEGLDDIGLTLAHSKEIEAYERAHPSPYPTP